VHQRRSAVVTLCVLVALVAGACMSATTSRVTAEDAGMTRSSDSLDVRTSGRAALQELRDQPGAQDAPGRERVDSEAPQDAADSDDPTPSGDEPRWQVSPQWALHPEVLQGTPRFRQLARKGAPTPGEQPNIVLITTDDQNVNEMRWMPQTRALLGGPGATFSDSVSPHPLCCPARAMTLTGQYAQNNGVRSNFWPSGGYYKLDNTNTLPVWLQDAGYETAFMGKYLNEYGLLDPQDVPPGWDHWRSAVDNGVYDYYAYAMNEDGRVHQYTDTYQTEYYADETEDLVEQMSRDDQPFFLWQSHLAPHSACPSDYSDQECWDSPTPNMSYDNLFDDVPLPQRRVPSFNEADVSDKPKWISRPPLDKTEQRHLTELFQRRIESLQSVDDAVARTLSALDEAGELDDTLVIFSSDNGYLLGEHRFSGKIVGYEPSLQVPLLMRGPGVPAGARSAETVGTLDLAPTIADAAGAPPGLDVDGRSLLPIAAGEAKGWDTLLIQGGPRLLRSGDAWIYRGVRTDRYTYMEYKRTGERELYDRRLDPYQLRNVAGEPRYAAAQAELRRRLRALEDCAGADCRERFGPVVGPDSPAAG
jgi:N-acetylglucosamine-6-sulfatase